MSQFNREIARFHPREIMAQFPLLPYVTAYQWTTGRRKPPIWVQPLILKVMAATQNGVR